MLALCATTRPQRRPRRTSRLSRALSPGRDADEKRGDTRRRHRAAENLRAVTATTRRGTDAALGPICVDQHRSAGDHARRAKQDGGHGAVVPMTPAAEAPLSGSGCRRRRCCREGLVGRTIRGQRRAVCERASVVCKPGANARARRRGTLGGKGGGRGGDDRGEQNGSRRAADANHGDSPCRRRGPIIVIRSSVWANAKFVGRPWVSWRVVKWRLGDGPVCATQPYRWAAECRESKRGGGRPSPAISATASGSAAAARYRPSRTAARRPPTTPGARAERRSSRPGYMPESRLDVAEDGWRADQARVPYDVSSNSK